MRNYTRCFSRQCNKLTNLANVDVVSAFISRNTSETLVHKLGRKNLQTTKGLLDIATNHVSVKMWWGRSLTTASKKPITTNIPTGDLVGNLARGKKRIGGGMTKC